VSREAAVDVFVRTHLLPYDFCVTDEQVEHLVGAVRRELAGGEGTEFSTEDRRRMAAVAQEAIRGWREDHWRAEEKRRDALLLVREFLLTEAGPEAKERLRDRFRIASSAAIEEEIERRAHSWLCDLPDGCLAPMDPAELQDLVFSQIRFWCQPPSVATGGAGSMAGLPAPTAAVAKPL
jgi:hypothetical protein